MRGVNSEGFITLSNYYTTRSMDHKFEDTVGGDEDDESRDRGGTGAKDIPVKQNELKQYSLKGRGSPSPTAAGGFSLASPGAPRDCCELPGASNRTRAG